MKPGTDFNSANGMAAFMDDTGTGKRDGGPLSWLADFGACLGFFSRFPMPASPTAPDFRRAWRAAPLAGFIIGAFAGAVLSVLLWIGFGANLAAALALAALVAVTGALHEDGLSDVADGFGGGRDRDRRLEIMRDSRLGTYGAAAVVLSLLIRWAAIAALAREPGSGPLLALAAAGGVSRGLAIALPRMIPPARTDGVAARTGAISGRHLVEAIVLVVLVAVLAAGPVFGIATALSALVAAVIALYAVSGLARRRIGGYTGDVIGAAQQACEIAFLCVLTLSTSG